MDQGELQDHGNSSEGVCVCGFVSTTDALGLGMSFLFCAFKDTSERHTA